MIGQSFLNFLSEVQHRLDELLKCITASKHQIESFEQLTAPVLRLYCSPGSKTRKCGKSKAGRLVKETTSELKPINWALQKLRTF